MGWGGARVDSSSCFDLLGQLGSRVISREQGEGVCGGGWFRAKWEGRKQSYRVGGVNKWAHHTITLVRLAVVALKWL